MRIRLQNIDDVWMAAHAPDGTITRATVEVTTIGGHPALRVDLAEFGRLPAGCMRQLIVPARQIVDAADRRMVEETATAAVAAESARWRANTHAWLNRNCG